MSKLPESHQAFEEQLAQFYAKHGAILTPPSILQIPLDCYLVFNAVAERGGYEGVSGTRYVELTTCTWLHTPGSSCHVLATAKFVHFMAKFEILTAFVSGDIVMS